jgi:hypothetical protein
MATPFFMDPNYPLAGGTGRRGVNPAGGGSAPTPNSTPNPAAPAVIPPGMTRRPDGRLVPIAATPTPKPATPVPAAPRPVATKPVVTAPKPTTPVPPGGMVNATGGGLKPPGSAPTATPVNPMTSALPPRYQDMVNRGIPEATVRQRWADFLGGKLPAQGGVPPGGGPASPGSPQGPIGTAPGGGPPIPGVGVRPTGPGVGGPGMPGQQGGGVPPDFTDPLLAFMAAVPGMNANAYKQIGGAMADAGFTGNRFSTYAAGKAGEIGAKNSLDQNAMLLSALNQMTNQREDRALQATGMSLTAAQLQEQMAQNRLMLPFQIGQYEQGRQDDYGRMAYEDFERNKLGWFPYLLQAAQGVGTGSPGQVYTTQTPGKPGAVDWLTALGPLLGAVL